MNGPWMDERRKRRLRANVLRRKVLAAERPGGEEAATSLLIASCNALKRLHLAGSIPEDDWVALEFLVRGLDEWVKGVEIADALCIRKAKGRPKASPLLAILDYVMPVSLLLDNGMSLTDAMQKVASDNDVTVRTVERAWRLGGGMEGYSRRRLMESTDK